jgi:heme oxygenase (staphylobilin-producing)
MFIAVTKITLPAEQLDRMAEGFRRSAPDLKRFDGFLGLELWRDGESLQAISRWESQAAMEAYQHSELFRAHHGSGAQPGGHPHGAAAHPDSQSAHGGASSSAHYDAEVVV